MKRGLALAALLVPGIATSHPVALHVATPGCSDASFSVDALLRAVDLELRSQGDVVGHQPGAPRLTLALLDCRGEHVRIALEDSAGTRTIVRDVDSIEVEPTTRARVIALATAELLQRERMPWPPLRTAPVPLPTPPAPVERLDNWAALRVHARAFSGSSSVWLGPELAYDRRLPGPFEMETRGSVAATGGEDPLGRARLGLASITFAGFVVARPHPSVRIGFGPAIELGVGWASGTANAGALAASGAAPLLAFAAESTLRARVHRQLWLTMSMRAGAAALGMYARAAERQVAGAQGPSLALATGLAIAF